MRGIFATLLFSFLAKLATDCTVREHRMASKRSLRDEDQAYGRPEGKRPRQSQNLEENSDEEFEESQESSQEYDYLSTQNEREGCKSSGILVRCSIDYLWLQLFSYSKFQLFTCNLILSFPARHSKKLRLA